MAGLRSVIPAPRSGCGRPLARPAALQQLHGFLRSCRARLRGHPPRSIRQNVRMADLDRQPSWDRTTAHLEAAQRLLPQIDGEGTRDFLDYVAHNELGLAFVSWPKSARTRGLSKGSGSRWKRAVGEMKIAAGDEVHGRTVSTVQEWIAKEDLYPCPCCGYLVFRDMPGSYDICPICGWEDADLSQLRFPTMSGANPPLIECQVAFQVKRISGRTFLFVRNRELRSRSRIRPIEPALDHIEQAVAGVDYGATYDHNLAKYDYWRTGR